MNPVDSTGQQEAAAVRPPAGLARLIAPIGVEEFVAEYWERKPLIVHRDDPGYFRDLLTLEQLDRILSTTNVRNTDLRVLDGGEETPVSSLHAESGGPVNALEALYAHYRNGATVSVTFLHERWEPLKRLCQALAVDLSAQMQTNVYLTPAGGNQGLVPHHDTHDVLVAQIHGTKHWCLYQNQVELPLAKHRFEKTQDPGLPVEEFDLHPGDLLYMPRGQVHAATSKDSASCHLTVGVRPMVWAQLIGEAVDRIVGEDVAFRRSLPPGFGTSEPLQEQARATAEQLFDAVRTALSGPELVATARQQAWLSRQPALHGHLLDLETLSSIDLDVWLCSRPDLLWRLDRAGDQVVLEFHGKRVGFPAHVENALRFIGRGECFTGAGLPGSLDETGRIVLLRTLVREGFLTAA